MTLSKVRDFIGKELSSPTKPSFIREYDIVARVDGIKVNQDTNEESQEQPESNSNPNTDTKPPEQIITLRISDTS